MKITIGIFAGFGFGITAVECILGSNSISSLCCAILFGGILIANLFN